MTAEPTRVDLPVPCLCGHALHLGGKCAHGTCRCATSCPDYVAHAVATGQPVTPELRWYTEQNKVAFGWRPTNARKARCTYCDGKFWTTRKHARTCSGACRVAYHRALQHESDVDVPSAAARSECYAHDRADATGFGLMTAGEQYAADMRVRKQARRKRVPRSR